MNASELNINNIVEYNGMNLIVISVICPAPRSPERFNNEWCLDLLCDGIITVTIKEITPILITDEWLLVFGFYFEFTNGGFLKWQKGNFKLLDRKLPHPIEMKPILYVHQLQKLYFSLTGEELTINPPH